MVRLIFIIALVLNLQSVQVDYIAAFVQAPLTDDAYVEMPWGFCEDRQVYKLKRNLYGLKQAARNFYQHLKQKLLAQGFRESKLDACLFLHNNMIVLIYVNDCIFFSCNKPNIKTMINKLQHDKLEIEPEHDMTEFLGVLVERNGDDNSHTHPNRPHW